jgi:hypothetical protein
MLIYFIKKENTNAFYITSGNDVNKIISELETWSGDKVSLYKTLNMEFDILHLILYYFKGQIIKGNWYRIFPAEINHVEEVIQYSINVLRSVYISRPLLDERDNEIMASIKEIYSNPPTNTCNLL